LNDENLSQKLKNVNNTIPKLNVKILLNRISGKNHDRNFCLKKFGEKEKTTGKPLEV